MASDPADILNQALSQIGWPKPIGDLWEGSRASVIGLQIYGQTRDELLRATDWDFARTTATLVNAGAPAPFPWDFAWLYPANCLYLREVIPSDAEMTGSPGFDVANNPIVIKWAIAEIPQGPTKVILTNDPGPSGACYTQRIIDPTFFDPIFTETLVDRLAKKYALALPARDQISIAAQKEALDEASAMTAVGGSKQG